MKTVLITGAAGNLGKATVAKFLSAQYRVLATVSPRKPSSLPPHENLETYPVDLSDEKTVGTVLSAIFNQHTTLDAALLLAGGYASGNLQDTDSAALRKMISLNFETAYFVARPVLLHMQRQPSGGRIVLVGSRTALRAPDGKNALGYALSKSMLFNLADYLNAEGAKQNVVTSVIVPGTIDTPDNRKAMPGADYSTWVGTDEIAETLLFITGAASLREPMFKLYGRG